MVDGEIVVTRDAVDDTAGVVDGVSTELEDAVAVDDTAGVVDGEIVVTRDAVDDTAGVSADGVKNELLLAVAVDDTAGVVDGVKYSFSTSTGSSVTCVFPVVPVASYHVFAAISNCLTDDCAAIESL